jgi:hypothetical protein
MTDLYQRNNLFSVDGLVAVITGGGSGTSSTIQSHPMIPTNQQPQVSA